MLGKNKRKTQKGFKDTHRGSWGAINPVTKVDKSKKVYDRKKFNIKKEEY